MIDDTDLDAAVAAGILDAAARGRLVEFARARRRGEAGADEEQFRLLTGFNDIFVTIAIGLVLWAVGALAGGIAPWAAALAVAAAAWGLAEYFTRVRRMALPSIVLLLVFVAAAFFGAGHPLAVTHTIATTTPVFAPEIGQDTARHDTLVISDPIWSITYIWLALLAGVAAAAAHWWRFRVPITVAAAAAVVAATVIALLVPLGLWRIGALGCGIAVFALAMRFDSRDRARLTRRTDIAFWLHLLAAPLIVHPLFSLLSTADPRGDGVVPAALASVGIYVALGLVALAIDRRALLVSGLAYVVAAVAVLSSRGEAIGDGLGLTALVVGLSLVLLAAGWQRARRGVLGLVPGGIASLLPPAAA